jgi:hypothetical protein
MTATGDCENASVGRQVPAAQNKAILTMDFGMLAFYEETIGVWWTTRPFDVCSPSGRFQRGSVLNRLVIM